MSNARIELDSAGVRALLHDPAVVSVCKGQADRILAEAGEGYVEEPRNYPKRQGYAVRVDSERAYFDNLKHNTLLKALGK